MSVDQDSSGKKYNNKLSFNMAMIRDCIKLHISKIRRLEHAVAHAKVCITLQSVFDKHDRQHKNNGIEVHYLLKIIS